MMFKIFNRAKSKKRGFTLIELIIVIAILGILAAILVPTMLGIVNNSKVEVNRANARSIYSIAQATYTSMSLGSTAPTPGEYDEDSTDDFMVQVNQSLEPGLVGEETFTIYVSATGVTGVTFGSGDTEADYPKDFDRGAVTST